MDIYEYLQRDHKKVANLFAQFENEENPLYKSEIFDLIGLELFLHAESEAETFYKALMESEASAEEAKHGENEHDKIEKCIFALMNSEDRDTTWQNKVLKLKELVEHHVSDEEGKIFNAAKQVLTKEEAYILKEKMHYLKMKIKQEIIDGTRLLLEESEGIA